MAKKLTKKAKKVKNKPNQNDLQKQRFQQLLFLCVSVIFAMLVIVKKLNSFNQNIIDTTTIDLSSSELAAELHKQLGGTPEEISELLKDVSETVLDVPLDIKPPVEPDKPRKGWFSWIFGGSSVPVTYRHTLTNDGESVLLYDDHDPRLPEKPVEEFKKINVYRTNPNQVWEYAPLPEKFGVVDPDDIRAIHYAEQIAQKRQMPNPQFIFHNKLPKCGTTTMHNIVTVLADWNNYTHLKVESARVQFQNERALIDIIKTAPQRPLFLMKHHFWFDFRPYGLQQPTYINVLRNPLNWFESRYYFTQNGWTRSPGERKHQDAMDDIGDLTIDQCVEQKKAICMGVTWKYTRFFCGNNVVCKGKSEDEKRRALQLAKKRLVEDFYVVGVLEQFNDTLRIFERLMPQWFDYSFEALSTDFTQEAILRTKTKNKIHMSEQVKQYFTTGPLKYDMDLYQFGRALFNRQLNAVGLKTSYVEKH